MPQTFRPCLHALAAAIAVLLGPSALAVAEGPTLLPGDPTLQGKKIEPFLATTETGTHAVTLGKVAGRDAINILYQVNVPTGERLVDHIVLDRQGLGLVYRFAPYFAVGQDYLVATLQGNQLGGSLTPLVGGIPLAIATTLDSAVFEESALPFVLASLPLAEDYREVVPRLAVSASTRQFLAGTIAFEVIGRERIKGGDQKHYETWKVEAQWIGANYHETLWIAEVPPYLIRKIATFPNGTIRTSGFLSVTGN